MVICIFLIDSIIDWNKGFQWFGLRITLEWRIESWVKDVKAVLDIALGKTSDPLESLRVPVHFDFACFSGASDNRSSNHVNFELLVQHKVLLEWLKSEIIDVSLYFLQCFLSRDLGLTISVGTCRVVRLSKRIIWEDDALVNVVLYEMQRSQCVEVPLKNV